MPSSKWFRALATLTLILLPVLAFAAAPAGPAGRNLLLNPGFERGLQGHEWMPAGWDTSDAGLSTVFFGRDTLAPHSGTHSVNIANTSTVWAFNHNWRQVVLVGREAWGKDAVFSVWTRSSGLEGRAYVMAQAYRDTVTRMAVIWGVDRDEARRRMMINPIADPILNLGWNRLTFGESETGWVRRQVRVHIPPTVNAIYVRVGLIGTGQVMFDDASLTLVPAAPQPALAANTNLLQDPGFENGALPWEWTVPPFEGAKIERDSTLAHSGRFSMRCSDMREGFTPSRMGMSHALDARPLRGKRVRVAAWFRGDSLMTTALAKIYVDTQHGMEQSGAGELLSGTFDWTHNGMEYDVPRDAEVLWAWFMLNAPCSGRMWIDDASLEVVGSTPAPATPSGAPASKRR
jgi:hypothetical protein